MDCHISGNGRELVLGELRSYFAGLQRGDKESIGLFIYERVEPGVYETSPKDMLAFASTGGDGVHFSVADIAGGGPVVMTAPMAFENPNIVVGRSLHEFLCLGCTSGYFCLEQIAHNREVGVRLVEQHINKSPALATLSAVFNLRPWPNIADRLDELASDA